jgi:hypothetical protein
VLEFGVKIMQAGVLFTTFGDFPFSSVVACSPGDQEIGGLNPSHSTGGSWEPYLRKPVKISEIIERLENWKINLRASLNQVGRVWRLLCFFQLLGASPLAQTVVARSPGDQEIGGLSSSHNSSLSKHGKSDSILQVAAYCRGPTLQGLL